MPHYKSTYPYDIQSTKLGKTVAVGEVIEADENPDGNFFVEVTQTDKPSKKAAVPPAAVTTEPEPKENP